MEEFQQATCDFKKGFGQQACYPFANHGSGQRAFSKLAFRNPPVTFKNGRVKPLMAKQLAPSFAHCKDGHFFERLVAVHLPPDHFDFAIVHLLHGQTQMDSDDWSKFYLRVLCQTSFTRRKLVSCPSTMLKETPQ